MSKASDYAKMSRLVFRVSLTDGGEKEEFASVDSRGNLYIDKRTLPMDEVPNFIKWLKETFED